MWSLDFLNGRKQFVGDNVSDALLTHAGTPQGTLAGPNDFKLMINDLHFDISYIKYVDDNIKPITISGKEIERVKIFKMLGVVISSDLSWGLSC